MTKKAARKVTGGKEMVVVASKVKDFIKKQGLLTASELIPALNDRIYELLDAAAERTRANGRITLKPQDL